MNRLLSVTAAASVLVLCGAAGSAGAATAGSPAAGAATSSLQLASAAVAGHTLTAGTVSLIADALTTTKVAKAVVTPITADGMAYGEQAVTPASSPVTVAGAATPSALAGVLSLASPSLAATVTRKPSAAVSSTSLGTLKVLGLSVPLTGALNVPGLSVPAPTVALLAPASSTRIVNGFGEARNSLSGLTVRIPSITLPTALALPGAANLPALSLVTGTATALVSAPVAVRLLTITEQAVYKPAVVARTGSTPGSTPRELAHTGLPVNLVVLALAVLGAAAVLRRRVTG